jgi:outer membrane PBP1 activator LpoA protein
MTALTLAGCQTMIPKGRAPAPPPKAPSAPITSALPTDQTRNRVALLVPLTGPNAAVGQSIANAANLALIDSGGRNIRMTIYDTGAGAIPAAERAVAEGNRLFLGPLLATDVRAIAPIAARAGTPIVSFSNDSSIAGSGVFVMGFSPDQAVHRVVDYAASRGITKFAGLMPTGLYGRNASNIFLRSVEAAGGDDGGQGGWHRAKLRGDSDRRWRKDRDHCRSDHPQGQFVAGANPRHRIVERRQSDRALALAAGRLVCKRRR